jgi:hypothetical protein
MDKAVSEAATASIGALPLTESEKNAIIGGVLLSMLLAALDQTIVAPAMPTMARLLGHAEYLPWIVTGYLLTATATAPLYGKISDVYGRRPTVYAAILIFLAGSLVSAMAPNMLVLVVGKPSSATSFHRANAHVMRPGSQAHGRLPASPGRCSAAPSLNICTGR